MIHAKLLKILWLSVVSWGCCGAVGPLTALALRAYTRPRLGSYPPDSTATDPMTRVERHIAPAGRVATAALMAGLLGVLPLAGSPALEPDAAGPAGSSADGARSDAGVFGRVLAEVDPLSSARVYAYQLADLTLRRVTTNEEGRFRFPELPAGLYKIIVHKSGFVPAVIMLTRTSNDANQFLELELAAQEAGRAGEDGEDFWAVRDRIPPDVLRDITAPADSGRVRLAESPFARQESSADGRFATEIDAMTGVEHLPAAGEALVAGGQVGVEGSMGRVRVGLTGDYWRLGPAGAFPEAATDGRMREIALRLDGGPAQVDLSTRNQRLVGTDQEPVDFEAHRLTWRQEVGETGRARMSAQYVSQTNYYSQNVVAPLEIPRDSSTWEVEGSYTMDATERASFQAGMRYRDRAVGVATAEAFSDDPTLHDERLDLFGRAGLRVQPAVLVEYGLYTTLRDGSLSLRPHGGLVLQLGDEWQASTLVSHKVSMDDQPGPRDFVPAFYHESSACTQGEESCYKVLLTRQGQGEDNLTMGAVHREIGETLRLFFNDDFFNHLESLYLVRGDELPELQLGVTRRVTPQLLARVESNVGSGGGGIFYATDRSRYENSVRYLVTSLDTHYQGTDTGLFISFHHLEQELSPMEGAGVPLTGEQVPKLELQRLQLMLTQDLNILLDLAADWALKLNMELSRGSVLFQADGPGAEELRRRLLGGFAVRF